MKSFKNDNVKFRLKCRLFRIWMKLLQSNPEVQGVPHQIRPRQWSKLRFGVQIRKFKKFKYYHEE